MRGPHTLLAVALCSAGALSESLHQKGNCYDEILDAARYEGTNGTANDVYRQCVEDNGGTPFPHDGGILTRTDDAQAELAHTPSACFDVCFKMIIPHTGHSVSPWAEECRTCVQSSDSVAPNRNEACRSTCNDIYAAATDEAFETASKACGQCEVRHVYPRDLPGTRPLLPDSCVEPCEAMIDTLDDSDSAKYAEQCRTCLIGTGPDSENSHDLEARDAANHPKICGKYCTDDKLKTDADRKACDRCRKDSHSYFNLPPYLDERDTDDKRPKHDDPCWRPCSEKKLHAKHGQKHCDACHALLGHSKTHLEDRDTDDKHAKHHNDPCLYVCTKRKLKTKLGRKVCDDCHKDPKPFRDNLPADHPPLDARDPDEASEQVDPQCRHVCKQQLVLTGAMRKECEACKKNPLAYANPKWLPPRDTGDADGSSKTPAACVAPCDNHTFFSPALKKACAACKKDPAAYARKHGPHARDALPKVSEVCVTPCRNIFEADTLELLQMTVEICDTCVADPRKFRYDLDHGIDPAPTNSLEAREDAEGVPVAVPEECTEACTPSGHTAEEIFEPLVDKCLPCVEQYGGFGDSASLDERDTPHSDLEIIPKVCTPPCIRIFDLEDVDNLADLLDICKTCLNDPETAQYNVDHDINPFADRMRARELVEPAPMPMACRSTCLGVVPESKEELMAMVDACQQCLVDEGALDDESLDVDGMRIFGLDDDMPSDTIQGAVFSTEGSSLNDIQFQTVTRLPTETANIPAKSSHIKSSKKHHTKHSKDTHVSILTPVTTDKHVFPTSVLDCPGGLAENCIMGESTFTVSELPTTSHVDPSVWASVGKDKGHHLHKTQKDGDPYTKAKRQDTSTSTSSSTPTRTETITVVDSDPDQRTLNTPTTTGPDVFLSTLTLYPDGVDASGNTAFAATPSAVAVATVTSILPPEVTSSSLSRGSGTATWNIPWFTGAHLEYVTLTGPDGQSSTVTRADLGSTHVTVSEITKTDGRVVLVSERPFTWGTSPVDLATSVSWVPIATSTPASTPEPVDVVTSVDVVTPPATTAPTTASTTVTETAPTTVTVVSVSASPLPTTVYTEAEDTEPDVTDTVTFYAPEPEVTDTVTVYSPEPEVTDTMTVTQQVAMSSLPDSVPLALKEKYNEIMSSITSQNPAFLSWVAALPTQVPSIPTKTGPMFHQKHPASHLPRCLHDELVFDAGYLGESQPILGQVMWPWPFPPFQEWMQPDSLPQNASRPTSTTPRWPALFGGGEGYHASYTTDLGVCSDKPMQTIYSTVFDAPMSGASWDYDVTATTTVQGRPAFTRALLGHTMVFGSAVAVAPRFDATKTVTMVSDDHTFYPLTKPKGKYGTHSYSIRPPYDATKTVTGFTDKDGHFHLPHGPTHVIKGAKMSHLAHPQCTKVVEVMGLGICGGTAYDMHFNTITRPPLPAPTPCHAHIWEFKKRSSCDSKNCMHSFTRALNYTTVANMMVPDPFEPGNYVWQNATFVTSQTRPHWGISDAKGVHWPYVLHTTWREKRSSWSVSPEYLFAPGVQATSRMALAQEPKCWDPRTCCDTCAKEAGHRRWLNLALIVALPLLAITLVLATCLGICMPRMRRRRQEQNQNEKINSANQTVVTTHDPATGAATSTLVTAAIVGGAAGAAGSGHGGNQSSTTGGGAAGSGGSGAGTAAAAGAGAGAGAAAAGGDGRGTQRRAAEEGRQPKGVRFDEKAGAATGGTTTGGGGTTTAAAPHHGGPGHVDGVAERSGSEVFDVGSMRGRKRNRGEEGLGVGFGTGMEDVRF